MLRNLCFTFCLLFASVLVFTACPASAERLFTGEVGRLGDEPVYVEISTDPYLGYNNLKLAMWASAINGRSISGNANAATASTSDHVAWHYYACDEGGTYNGALDGLVNHLMQICVNYVNR